MELDDLGQNINKQQLCVNPKLVKLAIADCLTQFIPFNPVVEYIGEPVKAAKKFVMNVENWKWICLSWTKVLLYII